MRDMTDNEYCLYVNAREGASLWMILADKTKSEDEDEWRECIPEFARLIVEWELRGYIKVMRGVDWPIDLTGQEVPSEEVADLLADQESWRYSEHGSPQVCIIPGEVDPVDS